MHATLCRHNVHSTSFKLLCLYVTSFVCVYFVTECVVLTITRSMWRNTSIVSSHTNISLYTLVRIAYFCFYINIRLMFRIKIFTATHSHFECSWMKVILISIFKNKDKKKIYRSNCFVITAVQITTRNAMYLCFLLQYIKWTSGHLL